MPDRIATRLTFRKSWLDQNIYVSFDWEGVHYRYPHDKILNQMMDAGVIKGTESWEVKGGYNFPYLSEQWLKLLEPYGKTSFVPSGKLCILKPVLWNGNGYQNPDGLKKTVPAPENIEDDKRSYPEKYGYGHEEWNGNPQFTWRGFQVFHTETTDKLNEYAKNGDLGMLMVARHDGDYYGVGVAVNVAYNTHSDRLRILEETDGVRSVDSVWSGKSVRKAFHHDKSAFEKHWEEERLWIQWRCPKEYYHWFKKPILLDPKEIIGKKIFSNRFSKFTTLKPEILLDVVSNKLDQSSPILEWLSLGDFDLPEGNKESVQNTKSQRRGAKKGQKIRRGANAPSTKDFSYWVKGRREVEPLHNRLQGAYVDFLKEKKVKFEENVDYVDVVLEKSGETIFAEIKPTDKIETRYAIRAGIGQLLEYRFQINKEARLELVLGTEPKENEKAFVKHLGIDLTYFDSDAENFITLPFDE